MAEEIIYVVDDDRHIRELLHAYLLKDGYNVLLFADGSAAWAHGEVHPPDMWIVDVMMPGMDGYSLCRKIRQTGDTPLIMISAKDEEIDRIVGLELGSDDYMSKPFSPRELIARMKTIFRRTASSGTVKPEDDRPEPQLHIGNLSLLSMAREAAVGTTRIELTAKEFDLLSYFLTHRHQALTREQLLSGVWGYDYTGETRAVDDMVKRLRKKLKHAGATCAISTVWGYGYKLEEQA